jgi:hypothetical protein
MYVSRKMAYTEIHTYVRHLAQNHHDCKAHEDHTHHISLSEEQTASLGPYEYILFYAVTKLP